MPGTCVIGLQWGDEAKGKIVDRLTKEHDFVVRYQGGANAGHTVVVGDEVYKLSLLPSGILTPGVTCVIAGGVVLNPARVIEELDELAARGMGDVADENLRISDRAHVIFPWHFAEDKALDKSTSDGENIGTTGRGIGPCYRDKVGRSHAIRLGDMYRPDFRATVEHIVAAKNPILAVLYPAGDFRAARCLGDLPASMRNSPSACGPMCAIRPSCCSPPPSRASGSCSRAPKAPCSTSTTARIRSSPAATAPASASPAARGVPMRHVDHIIGVVKAYSTRVGGGPFPTELDNELGQYLRDRGNEYGTVTRRPRRCGWLDAVALRYTARLSGVDSIAVMLLDVLSGMKEIKICTAYEIDGKQIKHFPSHVDDIRRVKPVYESLPGWTEEITACRTMDQLPANARAYLRRIGELVGRPIEMVSVGPERDQTIVA